MNVGWGDYLIILHFMLMLLILPVLDAKIYSLNKINYLIINKLTNLSNVAHIAELLIFSWYFENHFHSLEI